MADSTYQVGFKVEQYNKSAHIVGYAEGATASAVCTAFLGPRGNENNTPLMDALEDLLEDTAAVTRFYARNLDGNRRDVDSREFTAVGNIKAALGSQDETSSRPALFDISLVLKQYASGGGSRKLWIPGVPASYVQRFETGRPKFEAGYLAKAVAFHTRLKAAGWQIQLTELPTDPGSLTIHKNVFKIESTPNTGDRHTRIKYVSDEPLFDEDETIDFIEMNLGDIRQLPLKNAHTIRAIGEEAGPPIVQYFDLATQYVGGESGFTPDGLTIRKLRHVYVAVLDEVTVLDWGTRQRGGGTEEQGRATARSYRRQA